MPGKVLRIYLAGYRNGPMISHYSTRAIAGVGLECDRYARGTGSYSTTTGKNLKVRHVSLIAMEQIREANHSLPRGKGFAMEETRRNIVTLGIDLERLIGRYFKIGTILMLGTKVCDPCKIPSKLAGKDGFETAFVGTLGGIRAQILTDGIITRGDIVRQYQLGSEKPR